ncbi:hypothetical protein Y032_0001g46 [Ancylostoma ceylanicum]|uniref:Uncharacterized protein n=1 Tax=Ancylostoma ceylanicum TaxID=53326 RepID=A0A016W6D8_9BILA|nr:hypothetical protein Y032_0001g46 [Ancylostoma ceylanicum]
MDVNKIVHTGNVNHDCHSCGPQHLRGASEPTPNIHSARTRHVDVADAGVAIVIDVHCIEINKHNPENKQVVKRLYNRRRCSLATSFLIFCSCNNSE